MSVKILLIGAALSKNLGGPSLLTTTISVLNKYIQDAEYTFLSPTSEDLTLAETYGINIIPTFPLKRLNLDLCLVIGALSKAFFRVSIGPQQTRNIVDAFAKTDIIIDIWGIGFCDSFGCSFLGSALRGVYFMLGKLFRKTVVKYTADLGPFESRWNRFFGKLYLQHAVDLILARNDVTRTRLEKLGITTPVKVCPDTAFLLEVHSTQLADNLSKQKDDNPIVGLSVSFMAVRQSNDPESYLSSMSALADYVVKSIGAKIVLIPNELSENEARDDLHIAKEIMKNMTEKSEVIIISGDYNAQQLKGIIQQCDVVIASRYHTIIASLSQGIPVIAIGWHTKYSEVLRLVRQEQYLCSVDSLKLDDLKERFGKLWQSKEQIRKEIISVLPNINESIFEGGEEVRLLLSKRQRILKNEL